MLLVACSEPPPPRSVQAFLDNPIMLEAALVKCARNRLESRYDAECVNARQANKIVMAEEEAERRAAFEEQSARKREQLRRAQEAAAEARRRAAEAQRRREEAAYLAQFGQVLEESQTTTEVDQGGNVPGAVIPEPVPQPEGDSGYRDPLLPPESDAANAPTAEVESQTDLSDVREELRRRNEE
jgi:hypothetical protein